MVDTGFGTIHGFRQTPGDVPPTQIRGTTVSISFCTYKYIHLAHGSISIALFDGVDKLPIIKLVLLHAPGLPHLDHRGLGRSLGLK